MFVPAHSPRAFRFGPFEVDAETGELRKHGRKVHLQEKPFQLLVALLRQRGRLVTREALRQQLWPGDTFVDFDNGLNTAVSKLREALGDSGERHRYLETLARRGYRFVGTVEELGLPATDGHKEFDVQTNHHLPSAHGLTDKDLIVLADFSNNTGEPVFDSTLKEALAIDLGQSPFLNVLSDFRVSQILKLMGRSPGDRITP